MEEEIFIKFWFRMMWLVFFIPFLFLFCGGEESIPTHENYIQFERENKLEIKEFQEFLRQNKLEMISVEEILRQGTSWKRLREEPFILPPKKYWKNILPTLNFIKEEVIPIIGPIEILSGFRKNSYNKRAGGANKSKHLDFFAVDLIPKRKISRADLHAKLLDLWNKKGKEHNLGLGLYSGVRFHIDKSGYRKW